MNRDIQSRVVDVIVIMNTAAKNLRLYPPSSAMIVNTVDKLQDAFLDFFTLEDSLDFAEAEKKLLVCGEVLPPKEQERPQVAYLVEFLLNFALKSITFQKGMSKDELLVLLGLMAQQPGVGKNRDVDLQAVLTETQVTHIIPNQKVYIAKAQDNQLLASLDIKDEEILNYMAEAYPDRDLDIDKIRSMAMEDDFISSVFQSGMKQIMSGRGKVENKILTESMMRLFTVLDKMTSRLDQNKICNLIAKSVADLDPEMIGLILNQDMDNVFGGGLFQRVIDQIEGEKLEQVAQQMQVAGREPSVAGSTDGQATNTAYERLLTTDKGAEMQRNIAARELAKLTELEQEKFRLRDQVRQIIRDKDDQFLSSEIITSLSGIISRLLEFEEQQLAEDLIVRIVRGLASSDQNVGDAAATALVEVVSPLPANGKLAQIEKNILPIIEWITRETTASSAYRTICFWLKDLTRDLIMRSSFDETIRILETFNRIYHGLLGKNDTLSGMASDIIKELASGDLQTFLLDEFTNNRQNKQLDAGRVLVRLGDSSLNLLLDTLRSSEDSRERVRILQVIADIGQMALPVIRERLQGDEPWYYVRNLAYLLGRVGTESSAFILQPLLLDKNNRVREEALKSLQRTGGNDRGPLMMSALHETDDDFKLNIIEMLGVIKYEKAVPVLTDMLKERPLVASALRVNLEEKICTTLGKIGWGRALPILKEISQPKVFSLTRKYPEKVRIAATRALVAIETKQADEARRTQH